MKLMRVVLVAAVVSAVRAAIPRVAFAAAPALRGRTAQRLSSYRVGLGAGSEHRGLSSLKAAASSEIVQDFIKSNAVMVFSKSWCPFCQKAKAALDSVGAKYEVVELDQRDDGAEIQDVFVDLTGGRSVPRVFIGGKFIGGGDETVQLFKSGKLEELVASAGAKK